MMNKIEKYIFKCFNELVIKSGQNEFPSELPQTLLLVFALRTFDKSGTLEFQCSQPCEMWKTGDKPRASPKTASHVKLKRVYTRNKIAP